VLPMSGSFLDPVSDGQKSHVLLTEMSGNFTVFRQWSPCAAGRSVSFYTHLRSGPDHF